MDANGIIKGIVEQLSNAGVGQRWTIQDVETADRLAFVAGMREAAMVARSYGRLDTAAAIASAADAIERGE